MGGSFEDNLIEHILTINTNKLTYQNLNSFIDCIIESRNYELRKYHLVTSTLHKALSQIQMATHH